MGKFIRADIYRIVRGKALYITFVLLLALNVLTVAIEQQGTVGAGMYELDEAYGHNPAHTRFDGIHIVPVLYESMDNTAYYLLPLFILAAAPMFSHGTVKNTLSCGTARTKLYLSKLILTSGLTVAMMLFYLASGVLVATIFHGYGGTSPDGYWLHVLKICSAQLLLLLALNCVGTFLVFAFRRTAIVNGVYIAFCLVPAVVIMALTNVSEGFVRIYDFDLLGNIRKFGFIDALTAADILKGFATGAFYIIAPTIAGIALFKKAEIK
ncbi:MAG: ABC transporter permease [Oscillospiraceae bacterium]|nr:ABC transporter permease [Oscillospiraceae bacterium]